METIVKTEIDKKVVSLFKSIIPKKGTRYALNGVNYNAKTNELCVTDGRQLAVVKFKANLNLEDGMYNIMNGACIVKSDIEGRFFDYRDVLPEADKENLVKSCSDLLKGIISVMIRKQIAINIFAFEKSLKALSKLDVAFDMYVTAPDSPLLIKGNNNYYSIEYIVMSFNLG